MPANKALSRAKVQLMRLPNTVFYVSILLSLKQVWTEDIETAATDGKSLLINPTWFMSLQDTHRIALLAHEVLHVALGHITRRGDRHPKVFNVAADHVINLSLKAAGYTLPPNGYCNDRFTNMSTEQVYSVLWEEIEKDKANGGDGADGILIPGGADIMEPSDPTEKAITEKSIARIVLMAKNAAQATNEMPGNLPGEALRVLDEVVNPKLPWNVIYQNFMSGFAKQDYSWRKLNRRFLPEFYLPTAHSEAICNIVEAIDVSGSVSDEEFSHYIHETMVVQETLKPGKITVISFDTEIHEVYEIAQDTDVLSTLKFTGQGGTDITPILAWAKENNPTVMSIFTDGDFYMPGEKCWPTCPIIWLINNNEYFTAPFGEVIHYEI